MKKVLVAGAALMLAGSIVSSAYAEVNFSGDARARWIYKDNFQFGNGGMMVDGQFKEQDSTNYFDSRIRLKVDAKAAGGAYMKARIRIDDFKWDGQGWDAYKEDKNIWADYGYIGVPMGPVTVLGGIVAWDVTKFFEWDTRPTVAALNYKNDKVEVYGLAVVVDDDSNALDNLEDNNARAYGAYVKGNITEDWSVLGYGLYLSDDRDYNADLTRRTGDNSGFLGTLHADGKVANFGLEGELSFKESDVLGNVNDDDGWGGYVQGSMDMGAFTPALTLGFTQNGFQADNDYGWIMIGSALPTTVVDVGTPAGDTWFAALTTGYQVSEQLKLGANLVYLDVDIDTDAVSVNRAMDLWEISGIVSYAVSEGADVNWRMGYLSPDYDGRLDAAGVQDDGAFGTYLEMVIKY